MSEDDIERDGEKDQPTRVGGTGKDLLGWLKPGRSRSSSGEQTTDDRRDDSGAAVDRRTYMLMAGGAATAAVGGTVTSGAVSGSGTQLQQPDIYGYGGSSLEPSGQSTTLLSGTADSNSVTQSGENANRATAMAIDPGTLVNATLDTATVDWFVFEAAEGDPITVDYDREHERGITGLILYEPDGSFKEKLYVGTGSVHTMSDLATESGEHYLQVIDVTDGAGEYAFTVWLDEDPERGDDNENGGDGGDDSTDGSQQPYHGIPLEIPGRIQAQEFDEGGQEVAYYDTTEENQGGAYRTDESVDIEDSRESNGEFSVGFVEEGEWLEYTVEVQPGTYELSAVVSTPRTGNEFAVELDGERLSRVTVPDTGGWFDWETVTLEGIEIERSGTSILRVAFLDTGSNLNWLEFDLVDEEESDDTDDDDTDDDDDGGDDTDDDDHFGKLGYGEGPYGGTDAN